MMDYTDRFLRYMLRRLSTRQTLYTEMVTANTIVHCSESELPRFLGHDGDREQPLVLQLGGADPEMLRRATEISVPWGFTALNLNVGCPSDRVAGSGCFGAALMREPELVGDCCAAMADAAGGAVPVTVKCRIGVTSDKSRAAEVDDEPTYEELARFVDTVSTRGGVDAFIVHARKAVLGGLSPAQNRQVPPLRYNLVRRLASDFPHLRFSLNGGIETIDDALRELGYPEHGGGNGNGGSGNGGSSGGRLSGVMVGRSVVARPWEWATLDTRLYGCDSNPATSRRQVLDEYCAFVEEEEARVKQRIRRLLVAPALNLFAGEPHGKTFRRTVDDLSKSDPDLDAATLIRRAVDASLLDETLDAPPGWCWSHHDKLYHDKNVGDESAADAGADRADAEVRQAAA